MIENLETRVTDLQCLIKSRACKDKDVLNCLTKAQTCLTNARGHQADCDRVCRFDAWHWGYTTRRDRSVHRGLYWVDKGVRLLDAIQTTCSCSCHPQPAAAVNVA